MPDKNRILLCEQQKEVEQVLVPHCDELGFHITLTQNSEAVPVLAREHNPRIVMLNIARPVHLCHMLKMDPGLYYIPLFVFMEAEADDLELQFLSNELFRKPFDPLAVLDKVSHYLQLEQYPKKHPLASTTRERWVEKKVRHAYIFEYVGALDQTRMEGLRNRIEELLAVGRRDFTLNLMKAEHIENIPASSFLSLHELITRSNGYLKIIIHLSPLAEELAEHGVDIDEYVASSDFGPDQDSGGGEK